LIALASLVDALVDLDRRLFVAINGGLHDLRSEAVDSLLTFFNQLGNAWVAVPLLGAVVVLSPSPLLRRRVVEAVATLGVVALVVRVAKHAIARARPLGALEDAFEAGRASLSFGESGRKESLPSGHTATVFAIATVLWAWAGRLPSRRRRVVARAMLVVAGTLTGIARVYSGMHFPLDVLVGAATGIATGALVLGLVALAWRRFAPEAAATAGDAPASRQDSTNP
jgi:undecaprenyl-diphosphatase